MSIWTRIGDAIAALREGEPLANVLERLTTPPEKTVAFTIAMIALGAKMAKADGHVTRDEVTAFREVFHIAPKDEGKAAKVFNLARQDVSGFEVYASRIGRMFADNKAALEDLLEGLFHIALADGEYHEMENAFLEEVSRRFGLTEACFRQLRSRHAPAGRDPYDVLRISPSADLDAVRAQWRSLVRETHPDQMVARGVPEEAVKLATRRLAAINEAWDTILAERGG